VRGADTLKPIVVGSPFTTVDVSKGPLPSTSCELHCVLLAVQAKQVWVLAGFNRLWPDLNLTVAGFECQEERARSISSSFVISVCVGNGAAQKYLFCS
jgi:hypothetical protein